MSFGVYLLLIHRCRRRKNVKIVKSLSDSGLKLPLRQFMVNPKVLNTRSLAASVAGVDSTCRATLLSCGKTTSC